MPRTVEITVPGDRTQGLLDAIRGVEGVSGLRLQKDASLQPPGDVITVDITNRGLPALTRLLSDAGVGSDGHTSFSTSEPVSLVSSSATAAIVDDTSDATWEEMEVVIGKNSNMTPSGALVMAIAGAVATFGIATNALHIVIGAMLIAPGFQPIVRTALGVVAGSPAWRRGLKHTALAYLALGGGAALAALILQLMGQSPLGTQESTYLPAGVLVSYWTTLSVTSALVTFAGGAAGALLVATNRAVLTAGVMVALALVPGATIAALALVAGELAVAASGALRWLMEVALVLLASMVVLAWKRRSVQRRDALLRS
jgi:hypothetical protein